VAGVECALLPAKVAASCLSGQPYFWPTNLATGIVENGTIFHQAVVVLADSAEVVAADLVALAAEALAVAALVEAGNLLMKIELFK